MFKIKISTFIGIIRFVNDANDYNWVISNNEKSPHTNLIVVPPIFSQTKHHAAVVRI